MRFGPLTPCLATKAKGLLAVGPMILDDADGTHIRGHKPIRPKVLLRQSLTASTSPHAIATLVDIDIPSVEAELNKPLLDGLQLLADDISQSLERLGGETATEGDQSRDPTLIGSRFFNQRTASVVGSETSGDSETKQSQLIVKATVIEGQSPNITWLVACNDNPSASIRLLVPREDGAERPLIVLASDITAGIRLKPEGRVRGLQSVLRFVN